MSVQPFAKNVAELGKLTQKDLKGRFMSKVKALVKKCNTPETATPFYCHLSHQFGDGTEGFLLMMGKIKPFKEEGKKAAKEDGARGALYVTQSEKGGFVLNLMLSAGKVKNADKLGKGLKTLVSPGKCSLEVSKTELDEAALEALAEAAETAEELTETPETAEEIAANETEAPAIEATEQEPEGVREIKALAREIGDLITNTLEKVVVPNLKAKNVSESDLTSIKNLSDKIDMVDTAFQALGGIGKMRAGKLHTSVIGQRTKVETLRLAVQGVIDARAAQEAAKKAAEAAEAAKKANEKPAPTPEQKQKVDDSIAKAKELLKRFELEF